MTEVTHTITKKIGRSMIRRLQILLTVDYHSMKSMKHDPLYEKAVRLAEGGIVEIAGHFVRAVNVPAAECPCDLCEMDSACRMEMTDLCAELDAYTRSKNLLKFAYKKK